MWDLSSWSRTETTSPALEGRFFITGPQGSPQKTLLCVYVEILFWLPQWLSGKESACNAGDMETWVQFLGLEDPLEEEMATHSSNFAQKTLWIEDPGELQSMVSQKSET